jgi:hypothetical protein
MNVIAANRPLRNSDHPCPDLATMAERELLAFFNAVTRSEQAEISADDWLRELLKIDDLPTSAREWRLITAKASTRLATRLGSSSLSSSLLTELQIA